MTHCDLWSSGHWSCSKENLDQRKRGNHFDIHEILLIHVRSETVELEKCSDRKDTKLFEVRLLGQLLHPQCYLLQLVRVSKRVNSQETASSCAGSKPVTQ